MDENIRILVFYKGTNAFRVKALNEKEQPIEFSIDDICDLKKEPDMITLNFGNVITYIRFDQLLRSIRKISPKTNKKARLHSMLQFFESGPCMLVDEFWSQFRAQRPEDDGFENGLRLKLELGS